jgi:phytoene dehydrogenase-like protein
MAGSRYDVVVAGGGHNGLTAAAYLARAGRSVLVLERLGQTDGLAVSSEVFPGVPVRLSRYSYLVSLLPQQIIDDLGLAIELRSRRVASYTPAGDSGLLVDGTDPSGSAASFRAVTGSGRDWQAWQRFYAAAGRLARRLFPTMTEPLRSRPDTRALVGDDETWQALIERPAGETIERWFGDDTVRGLVLTDALIGTFAAARDPGLRQNRCLLYHLIGNGTGDWRVPVGGMGTVSAALARAARAAGAEIRTGAEVTAIDPDGAVRVRQGESEYTVAAGRILANVAPATLAALLGEAPAGPEPEGAQLKINMVLARLPAVRGNVSPVAAFTGTFHVNEGYQALAAAHERAARGELSVRPPCEAYCHSLTDPSILDPGLAAAGVHTMTVFGLHMPARLFRADPEGARARALAATLHSIDSVLAEPLAGCLLPDADGQPCLEVKTPADLAAEAALPGGHIWHTDLAWPFADNEAGIGRWGVETAHPRVLLCGAGARRGGGVSGIGGHNAAMAILRGPERPGRPGH